MSENDPQHPENSDNFDRLLANRERIADFVNSFTSERVQRKAFEAIVCSLGLTNEDAPEAASVERLHVVPSAPDVEDATDEESTEPEATETPRRRKSRGASKKSFTIQRGLNFAPEGHPTFEAFIEDKAPRNNDERNLVACHYLSEMMGIAEVDISHILAAYQAAEWSAPAHPDVALRKTASSTGWIDTANSKSIKVVWKGQNYISTKMPAEPKKKSS